MTTTLATGQTITTSLDSLKNSLIKYQKKRLNTELGEFRESKKNAWILLVPGIGYDFINQTPYITYNTNTLFSYFTTKQKNRRKRERIRRNKATDIRSDMIKLERLYLKLSSLFQEYHHAAGLYEKHKKIFEIKKGKYENDEMSLERFINAQITLESKKKSIFTLEEKIHDTALQIELLTNSEIKYSLK